MKIIYRIGVLVVAGLLVQGCDRAASLFAANEPQRAGVVASASEAAPERPVAPVDLEIQTTSPDQAVKSWWRYLDAVEQVDFERCTKYQATEPEYLSQLKQVATGDVLLAQMPMPGIYPCTAETYAREIEEVKTESETRAVVFTTVKNSTPLPAGAVLNSFDTERRAKGYKLKYLVEKDDGAWKVSQVYRYEATNKLLNTDPWEKQHLPRTTPYVSTGVWGQ